jgi:predicted TIM-barrel fold metal-dependent hydrolase
LTVIDLHSHYAPADYPAVPPPGSNASNRSQLVENFAKVADPDVELEIMDEHGVDVRVWGAPPSLFHPIGPAPESWIRAVNERLAARVAAYPQRFAGFASIDAYAGEEAAAEVVRSVEELSLAGIIVDSTDGSTFIGSAPTRPSLDAAAELGVPVFVHPTSSESVGALTEVGRYGMILNRGGNNAASLLSVLHHRITSELPQLRLLFAMLGVGGLTAVELLGIGGELRGEDGGDGGIYFDTMRFAPKAIRFAIDVLGIDRVAVGTDWPVSFDGDATRERLAVTYEELELAAEEIALISSENARRFLGPRWSDRLPEGAVTNASPGAANT